MAPADAAPAGCLITRPEPGATETAARVAALGWHPVLAPALVLQPRPGALPRAQAVLLTSRAAARALAGQLDGRTVLAVGEATAAAAREGGAAWVLAAGGDAAALCELAAAQLDPAAGPLLLAVGEGYATDLAAALRGRGFRVIRRVAYAAHPAPSLPDGARAALSTGGLRAALFTSPRSAAHAVRLLRDGGGQDAATAIDALALSGRVASVLAGLPWRSVRIAARPDQDALLALLGPAHLEGSVAVS
ncbi:uroporphyrinogen-III synthase [Roseomonas sp. BN140053]|uniref:uroporphyrinogen-III synthase n=1 Tax=Roseomonas sp. BN140053 TaxID=3391898 RepID=UPI0039E9189F